MDIAIDTETCLITDTCKAPPLVCVSWAEIDEAVDASLMLWNNPTLPGYVSDLLQDRTDRVIGANIAFDFGVLAQQFPDLTALIWQAYDDFRIVDVLLAQKMIDIARGESHLHRWKAIKGKPGPYSLAHLMKRHFDEVLEKDEWRLRYAELRDVPLEKWPDGAKKYAIDDAVATLKLWKFQEEHYESLLKDLARQTRAAWWIHLMSAWGIITDQKAVDLLETSIRGEFTEVESLLIDRGLLRVAIRKKDGHRTVHKNTKGAMKRMMEVYQDQANRTGEVVDMKATKTGKVCLDEEACLDSGDQVLEAYAKHSSLGTFFSKDLPILRRKQVHSRYSSMQETGRTASSDPNLQNLKRDGGMRECFVPRPGFVFVDSDYDAVELRTFAQVCLWSVGFSRLAERLNGGFDPHLDLGAQLLGIPYEKAQSRKKESEVKHARQCAKAANFGFPGGMGVERFRATAKRQQDLVLSPEEAQKLKDSWFEAWPEAKEYFAWIRKLDWKTDREGVERALLQHFVSERYRGGVRYTEACNSPFQGLAADLAKNAGFLISRACYDKTRDSVLFGSRIVLFAHDQFIVEVPEEIGHECAQEVGRLMRLGAEPFVPDVPVTCTPCLSVKFSKEAFDAYDDTGRLQPWGSCKATHEKKDGQLVPIKEDMRSAWLG